MSVFFLARYKVEHGEHDVGNLFAEQKLQGRNRRNVKIDDGSLPHSTFRGGLSGPTLQSKLIDYERPLCGLLLARRFSCYVPGADVILREGAYRPIEAK